MPAGLYQLYRGHLFNNADRAGDTIFWNNNQVLNRDEDIKASYEDFILYTVIGFMDP